MSHLKKSIVMMSIIFAFGIFGGMRQIYHFKNSSCPVCKCFGYKNMSSIDEDRKTSKLRNGMQETESETNVLTDAKLVNPKIRFNRLSYLAEIARLGYSEVRAKKTETIEDLFAVPNLHPNAELWGLSKTISKKYRDFFLSLSPATKSYIVNTRKVYITYGDKCCTKSKRRACDSAIQNGKFDECYAFNRSFVDKEFLRKNHKIMDTDRGAGLWLWKPYIINKTLHELKDGEYLVYTDAGVHFIGPVHPALALLEAHDADMRGALVPSVGLWHARWCKRDAFIRQRCDAPRCHDARQVDGAYSVWRRGPHALRVVDAWLRDSQDFQTLSDSPNVAGLPNLPLFRGHRHDQAVLTNVMLRENWTILPHQDRELIFMIKHDRNKN